ncbi:MAG: hypothetical protein JW809_11270 [Pirellulales bacterium]|nr:hypothetical protein [Pirellulales bacterium]
MPRSVWVLLWMPFGVLGGFSGAPATGQETADAVIPERWTPPSDHCGTIDFALGPRADAWLRHDALGDPSFDSFERRPGNPIVRGAPPFAWPVNGFLFKDPKSGYWYAYVGHYLTGYDMGPGRPAGHSRAHRSKDRGKTWEDLGPIFDDPTFRFQGDAQTANIAPDAMVVFHDDRYHLVYDWASDNSRWAETMDPPPGFDNGIAYAWSERPEGPFHRAAEPILRTSDMARRFDQGKKYRRVYGPSLVRREKDWLVLGLADSGDHFAWGLMAMTAADPAGAWSDPKMVLSDEDDRFFSHTAEPYPIMVHDGYVYAPHASVGLNRNFQAIHRARLEDAHRPEAWRLFQHGTAWHSEPVPHEAMGIWGQSFSGFVDREGLFQVLFPSRERDTNFGTINLAARPWARPLRERGFVLSGHAGASLTLLRYAWSQFHLKADLTLRGGKVRILWNHHAPLGPDRHAADATIHPLSLTHHQGLELSADAWRLVSVDAAGKVSVAAEGPLDSAGATARSIEIERREDGQSTVVIDEKPVWTGSLPKGAGPLGLLVDPFTHVEVARFEINGQFEPAVLPWLYIEALTGAGVRMADWDMVDSPLYRFGVGAVRKTPGGRVKWNFRGRGFRLWSPKGPAFGPCELLLDGRKLADLDLYAEQEQPSQIVFALEDAGDGYHAVVLRSTASRLPVDSLDVLN